MVDVFHDKKIKNLEKIDFHKYSEQKMLKRGHLVELKHLPKEYSNITIKEQLPNMNGNATL